MTRTTFALIFGLIAAVALLAMWWGWRARARRDAGVSGGIEALAGDIIAAFPRVLYVSTTPEGQPHTRVAAPGLRYRGFASVTVRTDGVTIEVAGESPVHIPQEALHGSGSASARVGKAVEGGGLSLIRWSPAGEDRMLESSFRLEDAAEQQRFSEAVDAAAGGAAPHSSHSTQEDPR